jgi:hypothetical protein
MPRQYVWVRPNQRVTRELNVTDNIYRKPDEMKTWMRCKMWLMKLAAGSMKVHGGNVETKKINESMP